MNDRFRGHIDRDFAAWTDCHTYPQTCDILADAKNAWIDRQSSNYRGIGEWQNLRHLICGNVDQPFLNEIGRLDGLERLELEWPMVVKDLSPLLDLKRLIHLSIDSPRHVSDFRALLELPALRTLIITNPKRMADLSWLADAHHLEVIGIGGGTFTPYHIATLGRFLDFVRCAPSSAFQPGLQTKALNHWSIAHVSSMSALRVSRLSTSLIDSRLQSLI